MSIVISPVMPAETFRPGIRNNQNPLTRHSARHHRTVLKRERAGALAEFPRESLQGNVRTGTDFAIEDSHHRDETRSVERPLKFFIEGEAHRP